MKKVTQNSINEIHEGYKLKKWSVEEITKEYIGRVQKLDPKLKAFLTTAFDEAILKARELDSNLRKDEEVIERKPLFGIPYGAKDLFSTKGVRTTGGAKIIDNYVPPYDATSIVRINEAGGILIGKLNQDAWGHGASGEHSDYFPTHNPWNLDYVPGGSSSGSGAAVAARILPFATATDTAGSARCPASFCGVCGLKPTYGRVSRYGILSMASSLDSIGHITTKVEDSARILSVTAGSDEFDATTTPAAVPKYEEQLTGSIRETKIGIPKEYIDGVTPEVREAIKAAARQLEGIGCKFVEVSLPHTQLAVPVYYIVQPAEVSSNLARFDGNRFGHDRQTFGDEAKRRIMLGTYTLSAGYYDAYYRKAMQVRTLIREDFSKVFSQVDALLGPVMPHTAFKLGEKVSDPLLLYLEDVFTAPINLAGLPALAVPCGFGSGNLPIGMQIIGPQFSEGLLFKIGYSYERVTDWHLQIPPIAQNVYS